MTGLRVALVTPRFWPLVSELERYLSHLGEALQQQGAEPVIVTARWSSQWPVQVVHRGLTSVRIGCAPKGGWSTLRYVRELARWLRGERHRLDLVYVANLRYEAYAAIGAVSKYGIPVVLSPDNDRVLPDWEWQSQARLGRRVQRKCISADAFVVGSPSQVDNLAVLGYPVERMHVIHVGASRKEVRTRSSRIESRLALAAVNHDLVMEEFAPLAVCVERLTENRGLTELIESWRIVADRWPSARLWIIGDGPARDDIYGRIADLDLRRQISLPGSFDDLDGIFQAADIYVAPSSTTPPNAAQMAAMGAGLTVVASATPDNVAQMQDGVHGILLTVLNRQSLAKTISQLFESAPRIESLGQAARKLVSEQFSLDAAAAKHLQLFRQLTNRKRAVE